MKNHDKGRVDRVDQAARVIAKELACLLTPDSSGHMSGLVRKAFPEFRDLDERKDATLIGLRMAHAVVDALWPSDDDDDDEASGLAGEHMGSN